MTRPTWPALFLAFAVLYLLAHVAAYALGLTPLERITP